MRITVKYFGMIAEWTGATEQSVVFARTTVQDLKKQLETEYPKLKDISYQVVVEQKIASDQQTLNENNELALLPPFAGG